MSVTLTDLEAARRIFDQAWCCEEHKESLCETCTPRIALAEIERAVREEREAIIKAMKTKQFGRARTVAEMIDLVRARGGFHGGIAR